MGKRTINIIILLMSIALFGIAIIQFYWLKKGIDLNAQNFNERVKIALNRVKQHIEDDADDIKGFAEGLNQDRPSIFKPYEDDDNSALSYRAKLRKKQIESMSWLLKPELALNSIRPADLSRYLRTALAQQEIDLNYDYGVFSEQEENFFIMNGNYFVSIGESNEKSEGATVNNLEKNAYEVPLFSLDVNDAVGSLRLFFPKKNSFLISSRLILLII